MHGASIQVNANVVNKPSLWLLPTALRTTSTVERTCGSRPTAPAWCGDASRAWVSHRLGNECVLPGCTAGSGGISSESPPRVLGCGGFPGGQLSGQFEPCRRWSKVTCCSGSTTRTSRRITSLSSCRPVPWGDSVPRQVRGASCGVGETTYTSSSDINYNYGIRPLPVGTGAVGSQSNSVHAGNVTGVPD